MASVRTIGLSSPWLDEREEELVADVLRSGRLSLGPTIDRFEEAFAEVVGAPYAAAVSSGIGWVWYNGISGIVTQVVISLIGYAVWAVLVWLIGTKVMPDPAISATTGDAFEQKQAAMEANGSWLVPTFQAA